MNAVKPMNIFRRLKYSIPNFVYRNNYVDINGIITCSNTHLVALLDARQCLCKTKVNSKIVKQDHSKFRYASTCGLSEHITSYVDNYLN